MFLGVEVLCFIFGFVFACLLICLYYGFSCGRTDILGSNIASSPA